MRTLPFAFRKAAAGGSPTDFVTTFPGSFEYGAVGGTEELGYKFLVGGADISVTSLGFKRHTGTYANVFMKLRNGAGTLLASATITYTGAAIDAVVYTDISAVALTANTTYHLTVQNGGSYNSTHGVNGFSGYTTTAVASITGVTNESQSTADGRSCHLNFKYTT